MNIKIKKLNGLAKTPEINNGVMNLYSTKITTEVGEDAKLVIVYHTDLQVEIPEGYFGLIIPKEDIYRKSIGMTNSVSLYETGSEHEIVVRFKTNTDVVPSVYKEGDLFAKMILLPKYEITNLDVVEFTPEVEDITAE